MRVLVAGDACEPSVLDRLGLDTVDTVVAATGDDEDNLVVSLLAKRWYAVPRVVARVNNPKNTWLFTDDWGSTPPSRPGRDDLAAGAGGRRPGRGRPCSGPSGATGWPWSS
jgi:TrkA-N domain